MTYRRYFIRYMYTQHGKYVIYLKRIRKLSKTNSRRYSQLGINMRGRLIAPSHRGVGRFRGGFTPMKTHLSTLQIRGALPLCRPSATRHALCCPPHIEEPPSDARRVRGMERLPRTHLGGEYSHVKYPRSSTCAHAFCVAASNAALCALLTVAGAGVRVQSL